MKSITTFTLLAGVTFGVPAYADLEWNKAEPLKMAHELSKVEMTNHGADDSLSKEDSVDPKFQALKKHVNDALDAHKGKAPKEMKGHHEEMKAYVARALDAQMLQEKKKLKDTSDLDVKGSLEYLFDFFPSTLSDLEKGNCFVGKDENQGTQVWYTWYDLYASCVQPIVKSQIDNSGARKDEWEIKLKTLCTSGWPLIIHGTCENEKFKTACVIIDQASPELSPDLIKNCEND